MLVDLRGGRIEPCFVKEVVNHGEGLPVCAEAEAEARAHMGERRAHTGTHLQRAWLCLIVPRSVC